jgi:hypothetical protein
MKSIIIMALILVTPALLIEKSINVPDKSKIESCVDRIKDNDPTYGGVVECSKYSSEKLTSKVVVCTKGRDKYIYFCPESGKWVLQGMIDTSLDKDLGESAEMACGCGN